MEYITYGLLFLAGGLVSYIFFNKGHGPFEKTLWYGLYQGKRVVVSIDDEAYIFELVGKRLRITRGTCDFTEDPLNGILADDVASVSIDQSVDSGSSNL